MPRFCNCLAAVSKQTCFLTFINEPRITNHEPRNFATLPASEKQEKKQAQTETDRDPSRHLVRQVVPVAARAARNKPRMGNLPWATYAILHIWHGMVADYMIHTVKLAIISKSTLSETTMSHREASIKIIQFYHCSVITNLV